MIPALVLAIASVLAFMVVWELVREFTDVGS